MLEEFYLTTKKLERVTVRLQRIWRVTQLRKAAQWLWRRKYAVLMIQRVARGRFARAYVAMMRQLRPQAATRIQRTFRSMRSRMLRQQWFWLTRRLTRVVLPKIKRFIMNCFYSLTRDRNEHLKAAKIQAMVRCFLCRARFIKLRGERLFYGIIIPQAVTMIQKIVRGKIGRRLYLERMEVVLREKIDLPATRRLQRIFRGHLGQSFLVNYFFRSSLQFLLSLPLLKTSLPIGEKKTLLEGNFILVESYLLFAQPPLQFLHNSPS
jgi:hypothetical protein